MTDGKFLKWLLPKIIEDAEDGFAEEAETYLKAVLDEAKKEFPDVMYWLKYAEYKDEEDVINWFLKWFGGKP